MSKKTQSALEYLMTYGWAILIIVIVGAALFALGVFNPGETTVLQVRGLTNFQISDALITADGNLSMVMGTRTGKTTALNEIYYAVEGTECNTTVTTVSGSPLTPAGTKVITLVADPACDLNAGDRVMVDVKITYTVAGGLQKVDYGTLGMNVQ